MEWLELFITATRHAWRRVWLPIWLRAQLELRRCATAAEWDATVGALLCAYGEAYGVRVVVTCDHWGGEHYTVRRGSARDTQPTIETVEAMRAVSPLAAASGVQVRYHYPPAGAMAGMPPHAPCAAATTRPAFSVAPVTPAFMEPVSEPTHMLAPRPTTRISFADLLDDATRAHLAQVATAAVRSEVAAQDTHEMEVLPTC